MTRPLLADQVEAALRALPHLRVVRDGDTVVALTELGRAERVVIAGHLDTVPIAANLPSRREGDVVYGRGTADMKGGVAVALACAAELIAPNRDVTWIFYDHEEVTAEENSLTRVAREHPEWLAGDFAVLMEPTGAQVEGGCQGTLRLHGDARRGSLPTRRAPGWGTTRSTTPGSCCGRLAELPAAEVEVDGLAYREGMNAVGISGGIAGNVIPDACTVDGELPLRPRPRRGGRARRTAAELFEGYELEFIDFALGARPGLDRPIAQEFLAAVGGQARAKYGWTDVARFSALGIPAVNFGPADPGKAHADDEFCPVADLYTCRDALLRWLG